MAAKTENRWSLLLFALVLITPSGFAQKPNSITTSRAPTAADIEEYIYNLRHTVIDTGYFDFNHPCQTKQKKVTLGCIIKGIALSYSEEVRQPSSFKIVSGAARLRSNHIRMMTRDIKPGASGPAYSANCEAHKTKDYIAYVTENSFYSDRFAASLRKYPHKTFWECSVVWSYSKGEVVWSQELRFSLRIDDRRFITDSMGASYIP